jgi:3-hydroxyacyl-CoA dehydrogenase/enoyl-CoA hydratase/3-hydroxybutyryl-CoA epimerase
MTMNPYQNFEVTTDDRGVTTVTLDVHDRPVNVINREVMQELDQIVHDLENSEHIKMVVFRGGKESGFLAGADVAAIAKIQSASEAMRLIELGQTLLQRIEWLPMPTIAVIHGPCLGGGLELALACKYRIARDNSATKFGLPEIKLGLIPAWGGTQRLPRVVGLAKALSMILTGKHLSGSDASEIGLVDRAISPDHWEQGLSTFILDVLETNVRPPTVRRPLWQRAIEATRLGRAVIFRMTARSVASKVDHYPALASAMRAVRAGYEKGLGGTVCERDEFVDLLATPTCRHLLDLFFSRERARNLSTWSPRVGHWAHEAPIRTVGVVGAGAMGAGIGQLAAARGFDVVIKEINPQAAAAGRSRIEKLMNDLARRRGWDSRMRDELVEKVRLTCDESALANCDLVIEAVVEREDVKDQVFSALDQGVQGSAILATNTSSLSVTKMAAATDRPRKIAGLHFFNPVHRMELIEVVRAKQTDDATIARLVAFVRALGKTPIVTLDSPGFLVNRVLFPYLGEAILMAGEGHDVVAVDQQIRRFGMPMGPLELLDQVGLDVALHVARSLDSIVPDVAPVVGRLAAMVDHGYLGKKSGAGFYRYDNKKRIDVAPPLAGAGSRPLDLYDDFLDDGLTLIQRRLVYPMLAQAVRCHEEGIVREPWAIDLAMVLGTGFAPHRGGPLHVIDSIGLNQVLGNLRRLHRNLGDRFAPPSELMERSNLGERFFGQADTTRTPARGISHES